MTGTGGQARRRTVGGLALAIALTVVVAAPRAHAGVLEIDDSGRVRRFDGPTQFVGSAAQALPIAQAAPAPTARAPHRRAAAAVVGAAATRHGLSPELLRSVAQRESGLDPAARSPKGATGLMQLMPGTARDLGVDARDPAANADGGARYLQRLLARYDGDIVKALAAYNAGPGAVDRHGGPPPYAETRAYVDAILERMAQSVAPRPQATVRTAP